MKHEFPERGGARVLRSLAYAGQISGVPTRAAFLNFGGSAIDPGHGERVRFVSSTGEEERVGTGSVRHGGPTGKETGAAS
jgi:hypothetical protein